MDNSILVCRCKYSAAAANKKPGNPTGANQYSRNRADKKSTIPHGSNSAVTLTARIARDANTDPRNVSPFAQTGPTGEEYRGEHD
jgi:hypothetical protein